MSSKFCERCRPYYVTGLCAKCGANKIFDGRNYRSPFCGVCYSEWKKGEKVCCFCGKGRYKVICDECEMKWRKKQMRASYGDFLRVMNIPGDGAFLFEPRKRCWRGIFETRQKNNENEGCGDN